MASLQHTRPEHYGPYIDRGPHVNTIILDRTRGRNVHILLKNTNQRIRHVPVSRVQQQSVRAVAAGGDEGMEGAVHQLDVHVILRVVELCRPVGAPITEELPSLLLGALKGVVGLRV